MPSPSIRPVGIRNPAWMRCNLAILVAVVALGACSGGSTKTVKPKPRTTTAASTTAATKPPATTTTMFAGRDSQRFCTLDVQFHANYDQAFAALSSTPQAQLATSYQAALTALGGMEEAAGDEIKPAVTQLRTSAERLLPLLAQAGFDASRLNAEGTAIINEPGATQAADRLGRYEREVCKRPASS